MLAVCMLTLLACLGATHARGGPLLLQVRVSDSAQRFYIVDQLARWSPYCHRQYYRWAAPLLSDSDRELLAAHTRLRASHGWGSGLERAFLVDGAPRLLGSGLTAEQAATEKRVLDGLAPLVQPLLDAERPLLVATQLRLASELPHHASTIRAIARLTRTRGVVNLPVFLIANPDPRDSGGGAYGGVISVEVADEEEALPIVLHEAFHTFLRAWAIEIERTAAACGLDEQTLEEGIAYALSPGIVHTGHGDPLADTVARFRAQGLWVGDPYVRFNRLAMALRPRLVRELEAGVSLDVLLSQGCVAWFEVVAEAWP